MHGSRDPAPPPPACPSAAPGALVLPGPLVEALWAHARREAPRECVGALGGTRRAAPDGTPLWEAQALYPLGNIAARPESTYLADPGHLVRALRAMERQEQALVALYHSHPQGPETPSGTDVRLAAYAVPYLIAALPGRSLHAYLLPGGEELPVHAGRPGPR